MSQFLAPVYGNTFTATVILTAANGDKVHKMVTNGTINTNGMTTTFAGDFTVNGGTGRFVNATGSGQVEMVLYPDGTIAQTYDGTIEVEAGILAFKENDYGSGTPPRLRVCAGLFSTEIGQADPYFQ